MTKLWNWLADEDNRGRVGLLFTIGTTLIAGAFAVYTYTADRGSSTNPDESLGDSVRECMQFEPNAVRGECRSNIAAVGPTPITETSMTICQNSTTEHFYGDRPDLQTDLYWHVCLGQGQRVDCYCEGLKETD